MLTSATANSHKDAVLKSALARIEELERTNAQLNQFVPAAVRHMIEDGSHPTSAQKQDRDVTVLFLDVEGYSALSEISAPSAVAELIEHYFSRFVDVIHAHAGEVNEMAGDGLMAVFQASDPCAHARMAVCAALSLRDSACELGESLADSAGALVINIGIESGLATVGVRRFAGRLEVRCTYTATGTVTNRAARLQRWAHGGATLIGDETARRLSPEYVVCDLGCHHLHNMSQRTRIHRVLGFRAEAAAE